MDATTTVALRDTDGIARLIHANFVAAAAKRRDLHLLDQTERSLVVRCLHREYVVSIHHVKEAMAQHPDTEDGTVPHPVREALNALATVDDVLTTLGAEKPTPDEVIAGIAALNGTVPEEIRWEHTPPTFTLGGGHPVMGPMKRKQKSAGWGREYEEVLCGSACGLCAGKDLLMPCNMRVAIRDLAEQGWSDEDIELLEKEVALARAKANRDAAQNGLSKDQQKRAENAAEQQARKVAHDRMHAATDAMLKAITPGGAAQAVPVGVHAHADGISHSHGGLNPAARQKLEDLLKG